MEILINIGIRKRLFCLLLIKPLNVKMVVSYQPPVFSMPYKPQKNSMYLM